MLLDSETPSTSEEHSLPLPIHRCRAVLTEDHSEEFKFAFALRQLELRVEQLRGLCARRTHKKGFEESREQFARLPLELQQLTFEARLRAESPSHQRVLVDALRPGGRNVELGMILKQLREQIEAGLQQ